MRSHFHVTRAMALVLMLSAAGITAASDRNSRLGGSARVTRGHEVVVFRRQRERHPFTSSFLSPDRRRGRGRPLHARFRPCTMDRRAFARHRARIVAGRLGGPPEDGDHEQSDLHSIHYMEKVGPPAAREHHPGEQPAAFGVLAGVPSSAPFSSSVAALPGGAAGGSLPGAVKEALQHKRLPERSLSVWVQDVTSEEPLLDHNSDVPRNPASTIKLLTALAALEELGPAYDWETGVYVTGPIREGRLEGDLVLVGGGDPFLVVEQLWRLLASVRARGLYEVAGRLVIDNTRFAVSSEPPPGDFDKKPYRAYNALPDALLVNFNALEVVLESREGGVRAWTEPAVAGLEFRSRVDAISGGCARRDIQLGVSGGLGVEAPMDAPLPVLTLSGRFPLGCSRFAFPRSVFPPVRFTDAVVRALWAGMGGKIAGGLVLAPLPEEAIRWHRHRSPPLSLVIRGINKFSNNVMARNLLLTLGAEQFGAPGTTQKGRQAVEAWLERRGVLLPHLRIDNGAGAFSPQPNLRPRPGPGAARGPTQQILAGVRPVPATRFTGWVHEGTSRGSPGGVPGPNQDGPARSRSKPRRLRVDSGGADSRSSRPARASRSPSTRSGDRGSGCAHPLAARSRLNPGTGFHPGACSGTPHAEHARPSRVRRRR